MKRSGTPGPRLVLPAILAAVIGAPPAALAAGLDEITVALEPVAAGLLRPVGVTHAGDGSGRLFILEQDGRIRALDGGRVLDPPFLDIAAKVGCCGERGLLGFAFHPRYRENGEFFVHYSDLAGDTVVARYRVSADDPGRADPASEEVLLTADQPLANHNGGQLAFGPDGMLYIGLGDGGGAGDPLRQAQSITTVLGKILRIDVDRAEPGLAYGIPPDNPFAGISGATREIWAYGLRNPWRFSFDRASGDLFIGDVGQNRWEEIDYQPASSKGGENYGWNITEGDHCYIGSPVPCSFDGLTRPILEYSHDDGCSVNGGYRYRGLASPALAGVYLFGDFCEGTLWGALPDAAGRWTAEVLLETGVQISSFGEDEAGEVYLVEYQGRIHRVVATGPPPPPCGAAELCLGAGDRFEVRATFRAAAGATGSARGVELTPDSGYFWFFNPANVELIVKVLDACGPPFERFWVFASGLTNVEVELTVRDTQTGAERIYRNLLGTPFPPQLDTDAFTTCP